MPQSGEKCPLVAVKLTASDVDDVLVWRRPDGVFRSCVVTSLLTLWRPLLPYGYSYKASCARPG